MNAQGVHPEEGFASNLGPGRAAVSIASGIPEGTYLTRVPSTIDALAAEGAKPEDQVLPSQPPPLLYPEWANDPASPNTANQTRHAAQVEFK